MVSQQKTYYFISWFMGLSVAAGISGIAYFLTVDPSVNFIKTLVEVTATLFGFLAIFGVYLLTSYDSRIDKLEEKIEKAGNGEDIQKLINKQDTVKKAKECMISLIFLSVGVFMISFICSLSALNFIDKTNVACVSTFFAVGLLLVGMVSLICSIYAYVAFSENDSKVKRDAQFIYKIATTVQEVSNLREQGFEFICVMDNDVQLFRKYIKN